MPRPLASILVPTLNGEDDLVRLIPVLRRQGLDGELEIRVVDSDSRDATRQFLREHGIPVERIEAGEFGHATTRNRLARGARGEFLVFLSQDALPADDDFVANLIAPFDDPAVAAVQARVLPFPDQDPLTKRTALALREARDRAPTEGEEPLFNNVASAIRSSVFAELPFPDVGFGEDLAWARAALARGARIAFAPEAIVYHAHAYEPREAFERYRVDAAFHRTRHGRRVRPSLASVLKGIAYEVCEDLRFLQAGGGSWGHLLRSPALRAAQVWGQFLGSRGPLGAPPKVGGETGARGS